MSLIPCTDRCVYQQDGYCTLAKAASCAAPGSTVSCVNFVPKSENGIERLADVVHPDQFQPFRSH